MEKRCTEATEYSLTFRMARYPNWRQVAENGIPAGDYSHARIALAVRRHRLRVILLGRSR